MSFNDPWSDANDDNNPYAAGSDTGGEVSGGSGGRRNALSRTKLPAIFLYIVAIMSVINHLAVIPLGMIGGPQPGMPAGQEGAFFAGQIIGMFIGLGCDVAVLVGAYHLQNLRTYGLALTGGIVACIPLCGPCIVLGIPFGIWALVVMNAADVKPHFQSVSS